MDFHGCRSNWATVCCERHGLLFTCQRRLADRLKRFHPEWLVKARPGRAFSPQNDYLGRLILYTRSLRGVKDALDQTGADGFYKPTCLVRPVAEFLLSDFLLRNPAKRLFARSNRHLISAANFRPRRIDHKAS